MHGPQVCIIQMPPNLIVVSAMNCLGIEWRAEECIFYLLACQTDLFNILTWPPQIIHINMSYFFAQTSQTGFMFWGWGKSSDHYFLKWPTPASFFVLLFSSTILQKNRLKRDSNSDRRSRRRACGHLTHDHYLNQLCPFVFLRHQSGTSFSIFSSF